MPQGYVLGSLLWNIYVNDLSDVTQVVKALSLLLCHVSEDDHVALTRVNTRLSNIAEWGRM